MGAASGGYPIAAVEAIDDGIQVRPTKQEVADLPPIDLETLGRLGSGYLGPPGYQGGA